MPDTEGDRREFMLLAGAALLFARPGAAQEKIMNDPTRTIALPKAVESFSGNKKMVFDTWLAFWRGDVEAGLVNFAEDATWFIPGENKAAGLKQGKDAIRRFRGVTLNIFAEQHFTVVGVYADRDVVVMEARVNATLKNGAPYENAGCVVWDIKNGKVKHVREYVDTARAMAISAVIQESAK